MKTLRQRAKSTLCGNFGLHVGDLDEKVIIAKMLALEIKDLLKTGRKRCRLCQVWLLAGKNIAPSRKAAGAMVCKTYMRLERHGMPVRSDAMNRLKHRLTMREWARAKAANNRRRASKNEHSKNPQHRRRDRKSQ